VIEQARPIITAESVTELGAEVIGSVLVAGSHGGLIACYLGAKAGAHALILNDAGIGRDEAGIAGLAMLDTIGMAAAAVAHTSARIGDGADGLANGVISRVNRHATRAGVRAGMPAASAAVCMSKAPVAFAPVSAYADGRWQISVINGVEVWALDSVGEMVPEDAGRILIIGSHGALHGGRPDSALNLHGIPIAARAAAFHDAGIGKDGIGVTRLPELDRRGIAAVTVSHVSARIGDGRSMWESGVISCGNHTAMVQGARVGLGVRDWVHALISSPG